MTSSIYRKNHCVGELNRLNSDILPQKKERERERNKDFPFVRFKIM